MKKSVFCGILILLIVLTASAFAAVCIPYAKDQLDFVPDAPSLPKYTLGEGGPFLALILEEPFDFTSVMLTDDATGLQYEFVPDAQDGTMYSCYDQQYLPTQGRLSLSWEEQSGLAYAEIDTASRAQLELALAFFDEGLDPSKDTLYRYNDKGALVSYRFAQGIDVYFREDGTTESYNYTAPDGTWLQYGAGSTEPQSILYMDSAMNQYYYTSGTGWRVYDPGQGLLVACDQPQDFDLSRYPAYELSAPPTPSPSPTPTASPTPSPTPTDSPESTPSATPAQSPEITPAPTSAATPTATPAPTPEPTPTPKPTHTWYGNNTVGLAGLSLREMDPGLTKKWYNVVPVDLTHQGVQRFDLVASNLFHIGQAVVTVEGGGVTVDYALAQGHGYVKSECVRWFTGLEEITTAFLEDPRSDLAFGQTVSIENDLAGQKTALLFICNRVTYRQPYAGEGYLPRYWPGTSRWTAYRQALTALLETLP